MIYIYIYINIYCYRVPTKGALAEGFPVKYSSAYDHVNCNTNFKLTAHQNQGWCAEHIKSGEWVQIDAPREVGWTSIETKGRHTQFAKTYKLTYSNDGITWQDFEGGTFIGNSDASSSKVNMINPGIKAKKIRIVVLTYQTRASMRFEAYFTEYVYVIYLYIDLHSYYSIPPIYIYIYIYTYIYM